MTKINKTPFSIIIVIDYCHWKHQFSLLEIEESVQRNESILTIYTNQSITKHLMTRLVNYLNALGYIS